MRFRRKQCQVRTKSNRSRRYTEEFERDAIALVHSSGKTVAGVARELGVSAGGCGSGPGRTGPTAVRGRRASRRRPSGRSCAGCAS
ncbi:transposase [Streptomyces sp. URMC 125]|uniref:transposase n=1 Tax=Streptomyces sp. URMC 125 TaxID=3423419 RepID=UPI003F1E35A2